MPVVALVVVYNSAWAKEINYEVLSCSSHYSEFTYNTSQNTLMAGDCSKDDIVDVEIEVKKLKGTICVVIYAGNVKSTDEYETIMNPEHEIMRHEITEIGTQKYSVSPKCNCYAVTIELMEGSEYANFTETEYVWSTNWEHLLWKLGLKQSKKSIDTIRMVIE